MIKDTNEQPVEEIHRVRSGRVPGTGASVPKELGGVSPPWCRCDRSYVETLQILYYWDFTEAFLCRQDELLTPFPAPLSPPEDRRWG